MSERDQFELFLWVLFAAGLGGAVGLEREFRGHEAGIRTTAIVCAGAALFGQVSLSLGDTRIAAGVVQGIGFLGAGLVFQRGTNIKGVTTAATIWAMAAVGLIVASELWLLALLTTVTIISLLELAPVSDLVLKRSREQGLTHGDAVPSDEEEDDEGDEPDSSERDDASKK
jgi:putative Mg2+ transporter-C (MgtC) family protein